MRYRAALRPETGKLLLQKNYFILLFGPSRLCGMRYRAALRPETGKLILQELFYLTIRTLPPLRDALPGWSQTGKIPATENKYFLIPGLQR
jgi:hypothetical protein